MDYNLPFRRRSRLEDLRKTILIKIPVIHKPQQSPSFHGYFIPIHFANVYNFSPIKVTIL